MYCRLITIMFVKVDFFQESSYRKARFRESRLFSSSVISEHELGVDNMRFFLKISMRSDIQNVVQGADIKCAAGMCVHHLDQEVNIFTGQNWNHFFSHPSS